MSRDIRIEVETFYVAERSRPEREYYFFTYHVTITNGGTQGAQLLSRHWVVTDGAGNVQEVRGPGVVGEQPRIAPGQSFDYTSACPLPTPVGTMHGSYQMIGDDGEEFEALIAPFTLAIPNALN